MKLTPLDIRHKEFSRSMRGYKDIEVDEFLDEIVEEFERLFNENIDYKDRLEAIEGKVEQYQNIEDTLKKTLVSAQQQADELKQNAKKEADLILRDAELKSRSIINDSYAERQKVQRSVQALKQKYEDLRYQIRNILESYMNILEQEEGTDLEEIDELIEAGSGEPSGEAAAPGPGLEEGSLAEAPVADEMMAGSAPAAEPVEETGDFPGGEAAGSDSAVRIPTVEIPGEDHAEDEDPFADLDTDTDDQKFKW